MIILISISPHRNLHIKVIENFVLKHKLSNKNEEWYKLSSSSMAILILQ